MILNLDSLNIEGYGWVKVIVKRMIFYNILYNKLQKNYYNFGYFEREWRKMKYFDQCKYQFELFYIVIIVYV